MKAWICKLDCDRWIVVTDDTEAHRPYYLERLKFEGIIDARTAAYTRNYKKFGRTVYGSSDPTKP